MIIRKDDKFQPIYKTSTDRKLMISLIINVTLLTMLLTVCAVNNQSFDWLL